VSETVAAAPVSPRNEHEADVQLHLAYAEASVLLIEALMLALIDRNVLSIDDLTAAVDTAVETKKGFIAAGEHPEISAIAAGVLRRIGNSLAAVSKMK